MALFDRCEPDLNTGCWLWTGATATRGYGQVRRGARKTSAHRAAYEQVNGPVPEGLVVRHKCDTPACINPQHLLVGTQADNIQDAVSRGRHPFRKGEEAARAKLTDEDVLAIRADPRTIVAIAADYGVWHPQISRIKRRVNWSHI